MFDKVLVANRGEIAVRIIRACHDLGIKAAAVYSEADRFARHVRLADEAYLIGPPPSAQSYLVKERIIDTALKAKAQAIHPGYGFLSENAEFACMVEQAGLVFIGPPASAIAMMGDKMAARRAMINSGVPVVPGTDVAVLDDDTCLRLAQEIGFPVLLKAAGGGGGKGMRVVHLPGELKSALRGARAEATAAFSDERIYIEKYLEKPRHIEIQVFGDHIGQYVYLGERECSIQRRHQKVIEEAPSPLVDEEMRQRMGQAAVAAAKAAGYVNAGTVEFLVDQERKFYFLEMNTRLQVEHPVTEMVTGVDMVAEQIRIAAGLPLSFSQEQIRIRGHAIECRIYAEDPITFLPATGVLHRYREPAGPGIRVDSGIDEGSEVSVYYDPLVAKLVAYGETRQQAIGRMRRALEEYLIVGVTSNLAFHLRVLSEPAFLAGDISTHFINEHYRGPEAASEEELTAAVVAAVLHVGQRNIVRIDRQSGWKGNWASFARRQALRTALAR